MPEHAVSATSYDTNIFFNCPFDDTFKPIFDALIFSAFDCGFAPHCALETDDSGQVRFEKILFIIRHCRLGVHDISRTELDRAHDLPRFNMPFELGLFIGAARFGTASQARKICLILDRDRYRFQKFISDISGQDIAAHKDDPEAAIRALRKWLASLGLVERIPGGGSIIKRYREFQKILPQILARLDLEHDEVSYADYTNIVSSWLADQPRILS
jgi:hypothetical protein